MTAITGIHPYADKFPMLPPAEHEELRESIRANGLRNPVVADRDGQLIDGRNRNKACEELGIEPDVTVYEGDDIAEYVIDCNVTRRNMSTGARAMAMALVYSEDGRRENGRWKRDTLTDNQQSLDNSMAEFVRRAGIVLDFKPDLAERVVAGDITLNDAFEQAKAIKDSAERDKIMERERKKREKQEAEETAERHAKIVADLTQAESKYMPMVEDGSMSPDAAWAAHRADNKKRLDQEAADRRNNEEYARMICRKLAELEFLDYPNQREWCIYAMNNHANVVPSNHIEFYTPTKVRHFADLLNTFAEEMEQNNAV